MELKIIKGGLLKLNNKNIFSQDPKCFNIQCNRINNYIDALFKAYRKEYGKIPEDNKWHSIKISSEIIYLSYKIEEGGIKRVLICYRDRIGYSKKLTDLIHLSLNENGSMHLTFDNIYQLKEKKNIHIFSNRNPDIDDGLYDLIEFINYVKNFIFNNIDVLEELVKHAVQNPRSGWYLYFIKEFEEMNKLNSSINIDEARKYFINMFREKYYEILEKFIIALYSERNNKILKHINEYRKLPMKDITYNY